MGAYVQTPFGRVWDENAPADNASVQMGGYQPQDMTGAAGAAFSSSGYQPSPVLGAPPISMGGYGGTPVDPNGSQAPMFTAPNPGGATPTTSSYFDESEPWQAASASTGGATGAYVTTQAGLRWDPKATPGAPGTVSSPQFNPAPDALGRPTGSAGAAFSSSGYNPSIAPVLGQQTAPPPVAPPPVTPPPAVRPPPGRPTTQGAVDPYGLYQPVDENGDYTDMGGIPGIDLPSPEPISPFIDQSVRDQYTGLMNTIAGQAGDQFNYAIPNADPATLDTGLVPQPNAQQIGSSPELARMLSGEGYNPAMLAQLHSRASEDVSRAGLTEMSQAKRALGQAGLNYSPAGAAVQQDVARRNAADQSSASRDIDIQNAGVGMENFRTGVGYQQSNASQNMQAANAMALANANRLYSALSQNLTNQQQMQMGKFGAETERLGNQASTKAGILGQQGGMLQGASLDQASTAQQMNNANTNNWQLNQAQLDRQRAMENQRAREGRWQTSTSILNNFQPNPAGYGAPAAPISFAGPALTNFGAAQTNRVLGAQQQ